MVSVYAAGFSQYGLRAGDSAKRELAEGYLVGRVYEKNVIHVEVIVLTKVMFINDSV
jgi:hypothetical protein